MNVKTKSFAVVLKTACAALLVAVMGLIFCACGGMTTLWSSDFSKGNDGAFNVAGGDYGSLQENKDNKTITLTGVESKELAGVKVAGNTYFGENKSKNYAWEKGGMVVEVKAKVDVDAMKEGGFYVWSLALNELDGTYLTELPTFFIGTENGVKFIYKFTGVDADKATLAADEKAYTIKESGFYTVKYQFATQENGEIKVTVKLADESGKEVYTSDAETFKVINPSIHEGKDYTNDTIVKEDMVKGLRYLWLVRTTVDVEVANVSVLK